MKISKFLVKPWFFVCSCDRDFIIRALDAISCQINFHRVAQAEVFDFCKNPTPLQGKKIQLMKPYIITFLKFNKKQYKCRPWRFATKQNSIATNKRSQMAVAKMLNSRAWINPTWAPFRGHFGLHFRNSTLTMELFFYELNDKLFAKREMAAN